MAIYKSFKNNRMKFRQIFEDAEDIENKIKNIQSAFDFELNNSNIKNQNNAFVQIPQILLDSGWLNLSFTPSLYTFEQESNNFAEEVILDYSAEINIPQNIIPYLKVEILTKAPEHITFKGAVEVHAFNIPRYNTDLFNYYQGNPFKPTKTDNNSFIYHSEKGDVFKKNGADDRFIFELGQRIILTQNTPLLSTIVSIAKSFSPPTFEDVTVYEMEPTDIQIKVIFSIVNPLYWQEGRKYDI
jgi:hypothetical protein